MNYHNPCHNHLLKETLAQFKVLTDQCSETAVVDPGYRGYVADQARVLIIGSRCGTTPGLIAYRGGRSAIEAGIGKMKAYGHQ